MTGNLLFDSPNPHGDHFYDTRIEPLLAMVMHITAGLEDLDTVDDHSAENTAEYCRTTDREVSWHSGSDTDSIVYLLPPECTAWHATSYNSCTYGHEQSKRHTDWRTMSVSWVAKTLRNAAKAVAPIVARYGIPIRKATRAELDRERANYRAGRPWKPVGFISHAELQPEDRTDPGLVGSIDTYPWGQFLGYVAEYVNGTTAPEDQEVAEDMSYVVSLPPTTGTERKEKLIPLPWRDADGGQSGVKDKYVTVWMPGGALKPDGTPDPAAKGVLHYAHWQRLKADGVRDVLELAPEGTQLGQIRNTGGQLAPPRVDALVVVYSSPVGLEVLVEPVR